MLKHYSHIRMEAKRRAVASLVPDDQAKTEGTEDTGAKTSPKPVSRTPGKAGV